MAERDESLFEPLALVLMTLVMFLLAIWGFPLNRGEGMYALIPREMLQAHEWLTPILNGAPYLDKPPLLYWLNLLSYHLLGVSVWAARLPTVLMAAGEVWLTWLIGKLLLGRRAAFLGGLVLLSSIGFFVLHLQLLTDHPVTLAILISLYCLLRWEVRPARGWTAGFHLALAAGFLSKGFIGMVFPWLIGGAYALFPGHRRVFALMFSPWGLGLQLLVIAPWYAAMEWTHPGFFHHQIVNEQIMRFLGKRQPPDIFPLSIPAFWLFLGIWLMPWTFLLPQALYRFWRDSGPCSPSRPHPRLLLIWVAMIQGFYTLSSSRIEYYSLPALPALALVLGLFLAYYLEAGKDRSVPLALLLLGLLGLALWFLLPHLEVICANNRREFVGLFAAVAPLARRVTVIVPLLGLAGAAASLRSRRLAAGCYVVMALFLIFCTQQAYLALSPQTGDMIPGEFIRQHSRPDDLVIMEGIEEFEYGASLAFYADRPILMVVRDGLPQFPYPVPAEKNYLITPEQLHTWWVGPKRVYLLVDEAGKTDPFFAGAAVAVAVPGKRLLVNHP